MTSTAGDSGCTTTGGDDTSGCVMISSATDSSGEVGDPPTQSTDSGAPEPATTDDPGDACTSEYAPVCGVDGETYDHPCSAAAAGVEIKREGPCFGDCEGSCTVGRSPVTAALLFVGLLLQIRRR